MDEVAADEAGPPGDEDGGHDCDYIKTISTQSVMPGCSTRSDKNRLQTRCDTSWPDGWKRGKNAKTQGRKDAKTQRNPHFFFAPLRLCVGILEVAG
jgi:hypothetical protein